MSELRLTDAQASAIRRANENIALRSGAGCGKTLVLARRFTELVMTSPHEDALQRFVALTFTDKAALEMTQRVRSLLGWLAGRSKGDDLLRWRRWLDQLPEARISTIHSFCASLLRSHAVEAGLDPDFAVDAESTLTDQLLAESAEQALLGAIERHDPAAQRLLSYESMQFDLLCNLLVTLVTLRDRCPIDSPPSAGAFLDHWRSQLRHEQQQAARRLASDKTLQDLAETVRGYRCSDPADRLLARQQDILAIYQSVTQQPFEYASADLQQAADFTTGNVGSTQNWSAPPQEIRRAVNELAGRLGDYAIYTETLGPTDEQAAQTLAAMTELASQANQLYTAAKRRAGLLDFTDLLVCSRDLLANRPALRKAIGNSIDQMLIDEAQDTDTLQAELLLSILDARPGHPPRPGRLFLVGDAKQSIYRFRGAQLEVFRQLCRTLGEKQQIDLGESFRTHPAGVAFINHLFEPIMGDDYSPVQSNREPLRPDPSVEILLAAGSDEMPIASASQATDAQARLLAQRIDELVNTDQPPIVWDETSRQWRPPRYRDIAVLFTRMTKSLPYERRLQQAALPYYILAGVGFFQQQEVYDVLNALRVIDNPSDEIALFGLLRSAMVGLDDNALVHIAQNTPGPTLSNLDPQRLAGLLRDGQLATLQSTADLLHRLSDLKDALPLDELIRRLLDATAYPAVLLAQFQGRRKAGNMQLLIEQARSAGAGATLADFIRHCDAMILNETRQEQASLASEDQDVLTLMTVHKAKGLEFPVVIVADLNADTRLGGDKTLYRRDWGLTTRLGEEDGDSDPLSYRLARRAEQDEDLAERIRGYYVALTRHEDHLVLIGADWRTRDGQFRGKRSFLHRMDEVLDLQHHLPQGQLPYGGEYAARLDRIVPTGTSRQKRGQTPGEAMLASVDQAGQLAERLVQAGRESADSQLPLQGPLPQAGARVELAATALGDFEHCPFNYHWRYELRAPLPGQPTFSADADTLPANRFGTLVHGAMEHLDVTNPATPRELLAGPAAELDLSDEQLDQAVEPFADMLERFLAGPLAGQLSQAEELCHELDFTLRCGPVTVHGQIDLLYRIGSTWRIVDYKTDRLRDEGDIAAKAAHYELQLLLYGLAVQQMTGQPPAEAALYFLRTGQSQAITTDRPTLDAAGQRVARLSEALIHARRTGRFERCGDDRCPLCRLEPLAHLE